MGSRALRAAVFASAMALFPYSTSSEGNLDYSRYSVQAPHAAGIAEGFPPQWHIPGARHVNILESPYANFCLIYVRRVHKSEKMSRRDWAHLRAVNSSSYLILDYVKKNYGTGIVYRESITPETIEDYVAEVESVKRSGELLKITDEMSRDSPELSLPWRARRNFRALHRKNIDSLCFDAVKRHAVEGNYEVRPAETLEANLRAGELLEQAVRELIPWAEAMKAVMHDREMVLLKKISEGRGNVAVCFYGGMHAAGDYGRNLPECSLKRTVMEWNSLPENKYMQFSLVVITPEGY